MSTVIEATFDGEVFRPSQPVPLEPNTPVRLAVETASPTPAPAPCSFLDTAISLKLEGPADWSANIDKYQYGEELHGEE